MHGNILLHKYYNKNTSFAIIAVKIKHQPMIEKCIRLQKNVVILEKLCYTCFYKNNAMLVIFQCKFSFPFNIKSIGVFLYGRFEE